MDVSEKLVELLRNSPHLDTVKGYKGNDCTFEQGADWLIAHGVTVQEWISVEDRLPEDQVEVLVLTRSMKGMRNVDKGYWSIDHFIHRGCAQVTHWLPMPELPERRRTERGMLTDER